MHSDLKLGGSVDGGGGIGVCRFIVKARKHEKHSTSFTAYL